LTIGRASGSCRLTSLVAPSGVPPVSRVRVWAITWPVRPMVVCRSSTSLANFPLAWPPARASARPGVAGHPGGVGAGLLGQGGQLGGPLGDLLLGLVGAGAQRAGQLVRAAMGGTAAVPDPGTGRAAGGLDVLDRGLQLADGAGQQPSVGRVGHVGGDHGGVGADLVGAQHLVLGGGVEQGLVQRSDGLLAQAAGELDQGGRVRYLPAQRDAANPLPGDRIGDLAAHQLIAQPVAELQEHHPQVGVQRDTGAADARIEVAGQRGQERRGVEQGVDPGQLGGQPQAGVGQDRLPQRGLGVGGPQHHRSNRLCRKGSSGFFRHSTTQATQAGTWTCWSGAYFTATSSGRSS
jgi:hypothetical protein